MPFTLVHHDASMGYLRATMARVGALMSPEEFIGVVSNAYHAITAADYERDVCSIFRTSGSQENFRQSLQVAKRYLKPNAALLNIGCGTGYDLEVIREVFGPQEIGSLVCSDISSDMLSLAKLKSGGYPCRFVVGYSHDMLSHGPFDMVITHSLVHHIPSLAGFFQDIKSLVVPGGLYVMGHEPNRSFWNNTECRATLAAMEVSSRQEKQWAKLLDPARYWNKAKRLLGLAKPEDDIIARVNQRLLTEQHFKAPLTMREIQKLVDVHVPVTTAGDFNIGYEGFDCDELQRDYLPDFNRLSFATSGYLGHHNPAKQSAHWQRENGRLAEKYPHDGSVFSAVWKKRAEET